MKKDVQKAAKLASSTGSTGGGIVKEIAGRTVVHEANSVDSGYQQLIDLPPEDQYYLDYTITFRNEFDWETRDRISGKIPGLAGGTGTSGCRPTEPNGWSARSVFLKDGAMTVYVYHQLKKNRCGEGGIWKNPDGSRFKFTKGREYRVTQRVKVNTPNVSNGENQIWVDGVEVFDRRDYRFRGNVSASTARVDLIKYHNYYGGSIIKCAPSYKSYVDIGKMFVQTCAPDFSKPPGNCK